MVARVREAGSIHPMLGGGIHLRKNKYYDPFFFLATFKIIFFFSVWPLPTRIFFSNVGGKGRAVVQTSVPFPIQSVDTQGRLRESFCPCTYKKTKKVSPKNICLRQASKEPFTFDRKSTGLSDLVGLQTEVLHVETAGFAAAEGGGAATAAPLPGIPAFVWAILGGEAGRRWGGRELGLRHMRQR